MQCTPLRNIELHAPASLQAPPLLPPSHTPLRPRCLRATHPRNPRLGYVKPGLDIDLRGQLCLLPPVACTWLEPLIQQLHHAFLRTLEDKTRAALAHALGDVVIDCDADEKAMDSKGCRRSGALHPPHMPKNGVLSASMSCGGTLAPQLGTRPRRADQGTRSRCPPCLVRPFAIHAETCNVTPLKPSVPLARPPCCRGPSAPAPTADQLDQPGL